ncbi:hypothetical protein AVEN_217368-1 [Araneus ventricosus]|uniref:Uncharacterized protein n=1 Tax=Araneus ventricosus TaxID=182803 RepID=A0A4Y2HW69_ARAVE|nr:hypothetical protein AVEN_217368-1 [Araneus ventricosus]
MFDPLFLSELVLQTATDPLQLKNVVGKGRGSLFPVTTHACRRKSVALAHTDSEEAEVITTHVESQFTLNDITDPNTEKTFQNSIETFQQYTLPVRFTKVRSSEIIDFIK